jgi:hypothetical protein
MEKRDERYFEAKTRIQYRKVAEETFKDIEGAITCVECEYGPPDPLGYCCSDCATVLAFRAY